MGVQEDIKELEEQISKTKYNKKTQKAIGLYKAKLARLKESVIKKASKGPATSGYAVKKSGDASVVLLGFPSVGKSTLLNALTGAKSEVAAYAFTTLTVIPGMMKYKGANIQILDVPGIVHGAASGKGRGREVLQIIRNADLILIVIDAEKPEHYGAIVKEVRDSGVRINEEKPDVKVVKKSKDGVSIGKTVKLDIDTETLKLILREYRINNADVVIRSKITVDQFIDVVEGNKIYVPAVTAVNKMDLLKEKELEKLDSELKPDLFISADKEVNIKELREIIFKKLDLIRLYLKEIGKEPDMVEPLVMKSGVSVKDVCTKLHKDFVTKFKFARLWGPSAKFPGQKFKLTHKMKDGDVIEIHLT